MTGVAWYDVKVKGGLRDFIIILHPPYTLWHLAYVLIGAALAPVMNWATLGWTVLSFFLGMGIGGHCLDEINGRPLKTQVPTWLLWYYASVAIAGAVAIGVLIGVRETVWVIPCIIFGGFIVFAYNMEWGPKGFFHRDEWFGFAWGAFPVITAYIAQAHTVTPTIILVAAACLLYSMTQRILSTQARFWRRKVCRVDGLYVLYPDPVVGRPRKLQKEDIFGPADRALKYMTWTVVVGAIGLLIRNI